MDLVHAGVGNHFLCCLDALGDRSQVTFFVVSGVILLVRIGPWTVLMSVIYNAAVLIERGLKKSVLQSTVLNIRQNKKGLESEWRG